MAAGSPAATIDSLLAVARKALAPDRRTAVFDVRGEMEGKQVILKGEIQSADLKRQLLDFLRERGTSSILDSLIVLPHPSLGTATMGVVSVSVANLRTKPGHASEMGTQALLGTPVRFLKERGDWFLVQTPDDYLGWSDDHIIRMKPEEYASWVAKPKVIVTAEIAFVRTGLDPSSEVVSDVVAGGLLGLIRDVGTAFEVVFPDGRTGILEKKDAEPYGKWLSGVRDTPESIVTTARRFLGVPYLWGGTSAKAFDCSGFTKIVYFLNGIVIPRDASQQAEIGVTVDPKEDFRAVQPGDLLFFGRKAGDQKPARVTHVAISLGGRKFIHEPSFVQVNSIDPADSLYSRDRDDSFLGVRRIIGQDERAGVRYLTRMEGYRP